MSCSLRLDKVENGVATGRIHSTYGTRSSAYVEHTCCSELTTGMGHSLQYREIKATENVAEDCSVQNRKRDPGKHGMTLYPLGTASSIKKATGPNQTKKPLSI